MYGGHACRRCCYLYDGINIEWLGQYVIEIAAYYADIDITIILFSEYKNI